MKFYTARTLYVLLLINLASCASPLKNADELVQQSGWQWRVFSATNFDIVTAQSGGTSGETLWVYIEGDGNAYLSPSRPSSDPTPKKIHWGFA